MDKTRGSKLSMIGSPQTHTSKEPRTMSLVELFCHVDDFCQTFEPTWEHLQLSSGTKLRRRAGQLYLSEIEISDVTFSSDCDKEFQKLEIQEHS